MTHTLADIRLDPWIKGPDLVATQELASIDSVGLCHLRDDKWVAWGFGPDADGAEIKRYLGTVVAGERDPTQAAREFLALPADLEVFGR